MIKVKDGYAKLINTSYTGDISQVLLSNGGTISYDVSTNTILATIGSNVASADKLKNKVKIWGQDFDGTNNVNGSLVLNNNASIVWKDTGGTNRNAISLSNSDNFHLGYDTARAGYNTYLDGNKITFRYGTTPSDGMVLNSNGNVGIGTTNPSTKLHVSGTALASKFMMSGTTGYITGIARNWTDTYNDAASNARPWCGLSVVPGQKTYEEMTLANYYGMLFKTGGSDFPYIFMGGDVGIGTNSPLAKLHVAGSIRTTGEIKINASDTPYDRLRLVVNDGGAYIQASNNNGSAATGGNLSISAVGGGYLTKLDVYATTSKFNGNILATGGFFKQGSSDSYVLLGGGGHKLLSELGTSGGPYLPLSGGTLTGNLIINDALFRVKTTTNPQFDLVYGIPNGYGIIQFQTNDNSVGGLTINNTTGGDIRMLTVSGGSINLICQDQANNDSVGAWFHNGTKTVVIGHFTGQSMRNIIGTKYHGVELTGGVLAITSREASYKDTQGAIFDYDKTNSTLHLNKFIIITRLKVLIRQLFC